MTEYSRRVFMSTAALTGFTGCLTSNNNDNNESDEEIHPEILSRAEEAQEEILEDELLVEYEEADQRVVADTARVEPVILREVGIGDAQEYRISAEADLGRNIDDLEGYVKEDRTTLIEKLSEPSYDMKVIAFEYLEDYDESERNVHQTRVTQYQTRFHGRDENFVQYRIGSERLRDLEEREDYLEHFQDNANVHIDGEVY